MTIFYLKRKKVASDDLEGYYRTYAQEWIDKSFADTTLVRTVKEEKYPFNKEVEYKFIWILYRCDSQIQ